MQKLQKLSLMLLLVFLSACGATDNLIRKVSPPLEGAEIVLDFPDSEVDALLELRKVNLLSALDPDDHGFCHEASYDKATELEYSVKLKCAMDGFYSSEYVDDLYQNNSKDGKSQPDQNINDGAASYREDDTGTIDRSNYSRELRELEVNNVAFSYSAKQISRLTELVDQYNSLISQSDQNAFYTNVSDELEELFNLQAADLKERVRLAQEISPMLEFQRRRRNQVQSSVITASDAACDIYKRNLNSIYSSSNFTFGSVATIAGGLGAIFVDQGTARGLAGLSGITSGLRAEYNDAFFRNKVVELLTKAMDIARSRKKEEIDRRATQIISDYNMEDALDDAILYNSQCSLVAGLQETSNSLQTVADPGLTWLANAFGGAASNPQLTAKLFESLGGAVSAIQQIQKVTEDPNSLIESSGGENNPDAE